MDAADLRVFEAVLRFGGMGRPQPSETQSNVTGHIRRLEKVPSAPLLRRHARGAVPTSAEQRLLLYARGMMRLLEDARRAVRDDGTLQGALLLGSLETTAALRLSPTLTAFAVPILRWTCEVAPRFRTGC
jgi:DNA-binding transcriptional LysR family regulator